MPPAAAAACVSGALPPRRLWGGCGWPDRGTVAQGPELRLPGANWRLHLRDAGRWRCGLDTHLHTYAAEQGVGWGVCMQARLARTCDAHQVPAQRATAARLTPRWGTGRNNFKSVLIQRVRHVILSARSERRG